jgi:hypothetical protein
MQRWWILIRRGLRDRAWNERLSKKNIQPRAHGYINSRYQIWVHVKNCGFFGLPLARFPLARPRLLLE